MAPPAIECETETLNHLDASYRALGLKRDRFLDVTCGIGATRYPMRTLGWTDPSVLPPIPKLAAVTGALLPAYACERLVARQPERGRSIPAFARPA